MAKMAMYALEVEEAKRKDDDRDLEYKEYLRAKAEEDAIKQK